MEEGIVTDPREADVGSILAFGFAPYTGGTLSYIDGIGAKDFVKIAKALQKKYGAEFKAPKLLLDMAEKGETFYQRFDPYAKATAKQGGVKRLRSRACMSGFALHAWPRPRKAAAPMRPAARAAVVPLPADRHRFQLHLNNARYLMLADLGRVDIFLRSGLSR